MSHEHLFGTEDLDFNKDTILGIKAIVLELFEKTLFYPKLNKKERNYLLFTLGESIQMGGLTTSFLSLVIGPKSAKDTFTALKDKKIIDKKGEYDYKLLLKLGKKYK